MVSFEIVKVIAKELGAIRLADGLEKSGPEPSVIDTLRSGVAVRDDRENREWFEVQSHYEFTWDELAKIADQKASKEAGDNIDEAVGFVDAVKGKRLEATKDLVVKLQDLFVAQFPGRDPLSLRAVICNNEWMMEMPVIKEGRLTMFVGCLLTWEDRPDESKGDTAVAQSGDVPKEAG